jgi:hypothetical protein
MADTDEDIMSPLTYGRRLSAEFIIRIALMLSMPPVRHCADLVVNDKGSCVGRHGPIHECRIISIRRRSVLVEPLIKTIYKIYSSRHLYDPIHCSVLLLHHIMVLS